MADFISQDVFVFMVHQINFYNSNEMVGMQ